LKYTTLILILFLSALSISINAQERVTTVGLQLKPIFSSDLFKSGKQEAIVDNINFTLDPKIGLSFGMVIRKGFTKSLSIETGINYLRRNYDLTISDPDSSFSGTSSFKIVNYEIPVLGLIYVQLGNQLFMNVAGGASIDIYPSDLFTYDNYFENDLFRYNWFQASLVANVGWEYRTRKSGYFYLGASYHRPFTNMMKEKILYKGFNRDVETHFELSGNYLTLDFRYFFHENPAKKKRKIKKPKKKDRPQNPNKR